MATEGLPSLWGTEVRSEWVDHNGHMSVGHFVQAFDNATGAFYETIDIGEEYRNNTGFSLFAVECHLTYGREASAGDTVRVTGQIIGYDEKRIHYFLVMHNADSGHQLATFEQIALHVELAARKVVPIPGQILERMDEVWVAHKLLPRPPEVGHVMTLERRSKP